MEKTRHQYVKVKSFVINACLKQVQAKVLKYFKSEGEAVQRNSSSVLCVESEAFLDYTTHTYLTMSRKRIWHYRIVPFTCPNSMVANYRYRSQGMQKR